MFLEHELILNWRYSKAVLVSSFDLLKDDQLILHLQRKGMTLKEYLQEERGFNKDIKLVCDTGIFEYEVKKAKLQIEVPKYGKFSNKDIFQAYQLIGPDFFIAPDEIIVQSDTINEVHQKMQQMIINVQQTIDLFPKEKIIPVLHGFTTKDMSTYLDFLKAENFKIIARGGLIPLWNESKIKFKEVIKESEYLVRQNFSYIHSFGLPSLNSIKDYFYHNSYDSLDTSIIYYRTAQRKFLIDKGYFISVRNAYFNRCGCDGCQVMMDNTYKPNSGNFAIGLYIHNCLMLVNLVHRLSIEPDIFERKKFVHKKLHKRTMDINDHQIKYISDSNLTFVSADNLMSTNGLTPIYLQKKIRYPTKLPLKILVISSCSKRKSLVGEYTYSLGDLRTEAQRRKILTNTDNKIEAKNLYDSDRIVLVNSVVNDLRDICMSVELYFLSAGFGLVNENLKLPPYDVTFGNKSRDEILALARDLKISEGLANLSNDYDMIFLDLSPDYLTSLQPVENLTFKTRELVLFSEETNIEGKIIQLNTNDLIYFDKISNYLPFEISNHTRISLLKNYYLYLINKKILGSFNTFSEWIQDIFIHMKEKKYVLRV